MAQKFRKVSKIAKNHAKTAETRSRLVRTSPGVPKQCIQTNFTIADAMRVVLPPHSAAGAKEMYAALSSLDFDLLVEV